MKHPQRVFGSKETNTMYGEWLSLCKRHNARRLQNGESPTDYPLEPVAYETLNFGWILSKPDLKGQRSIIVQM